MPMLGPITNKGNGNTAIDRFIRTFSLVTKEKPG